MSIITTVIPLVNARLFFIFHHHISNIFGIRLFLFNDINILSRNFQVFGKFSNKEKDEKEDKKEVDEAVHYYDDNYDDYEADSKPVNTSDGSANKDQYYGDGEGKDEGPAQLKSPGDLSDQDQSDYDIEGKVKVPNGIKQSLRTEIEQARKEAKKLDTRDKEASYFYNDLAKAFEDLLGHLEKGTRYDIKQAQTFAQTLMGPILHKIPSDVWKFLANGGEPRSLKSYMKPVDKKYPITGPRNEIK